MEAPLSPLQSEARQAAARHGLDPALFQAQIRQESNFSPRAKSRAGAIGIAQIMPSTAKAWKVNPRDPKASLNAAAKAMAGYVKTYRRQGKNTEQAQALALAAYNAGPGAVKKHGGVPPYKETQNYVKRILSVFKKEKRDEHV